MTTIPQILIEPKTPGKAVLLLQGAFESSYWSFLEKILNTFQVPEKEVFIDFKDAQRPDTIGAWVLASLWNRLEQEGKTVSFHHCAPETLRLLKELKSLKTIPNDLDKKPQGLIAPLGQKTLAGIQEGYQLISFLGLVTVSFLKYLRKPSLFRTKSFLNLIEETGYRALPIVGLIAFLIGVVLIYQGINQLRRFGAEIFTVNLLAVSVLRELGILLTAIVVAGRSGSSFTAQIGFMKLNQELDAMQVLGLDPLHLLVIPRISALVVILPLLTLYCDLIALGGGAFMCQHLMGLSLDQFLTQLQGAIKPWTFWTGIIKAPVFAVVIGLIGCHEGFSVKGGAENVGRHTTQSVVKSIFVVIVLDAAFSVLFSILQI